MKILSWIFDFIKPVLPILFVGFFAHNGGKKAQQKKDLDAELEAIRQEKKRRAKREMDSDDVVTDRLRQSARDTE